MPKRAIALLILATVATGAAAHAQMPRRNPPLAPPELLVDLARDYALNVSAERAPADVEHVRILLRAAARLAPQSTEPLLMLAEVEYVAGAPAGVQTALSKIVEIDRGHELAFKYWLSLGLGRHETVDARSRWLESLLDESRTAPCRAMAAVTLAEAKFEQLDFAAAAERLAEAQRLWPNCPEAALLAVQFLTAETPAPQRLQALLAALTLHSNRPALAWETGQLLHTLALPADAQVFFDHALRMNVLCEPADMLSVEQLIQISMNLLAAERPEDAIRFAEGIVSASNSLAAMTNLFWLEGQCGSQQRAAEMYTALQERCARITDPQTAPLDELADAAWFYCLHDQQAQRVSALATSLATRAGSDAFARRVLSWALLLSGQNDEALRVATPIAADDPYAAVVAARIQLAADREAARSVIERLRAKPLVGPARVLIEKLEVGVPLGEALASAPSDIAAVLASFNRDVLSFIDDPGRALAAEIAIEDPSPEVAEPWVANITLANKSTFPIALGPRDLVNPVLLLSFKLEGDRPREFQNVYSIHLDRVAVLAPGASYRVRRTIDVGPVRRVSRMTPQQSQRVQIDAVLDAQVLPDGSCRPGPFGRRLAPVALNRIPLTVGTAALTAHYRGIQSEDAAERSQSVETLGELLGESQRARAGTLGYKPTPVPEDRITDILVHALSSGAAELRVRALESLMICGLDARLVAAVTANLEHDDWLVRFMAIRVLARQSDAFADRARRIASADADDLVRALAQNTLDIRAHRSGAASQPTSTRPASSQMSRPGSAAKP